MDLFGYSTELFLQSLMSFGVNVVKCVLIIAIGFFIIRLIEPHLKKVLEKVCHDQIVERFAFNLITYLLKLCVLLMSVTAVGVETASLVALIGSIGFAVGLAFQGALSNFAGGILLLTQRPFSVNDFVEALGETGFVHSISILSTTLYTTDNKVITIPNGQIANNNIINYSKLEKRRVDITVGASYTVETEKVINAIHSVLDNDSLILEDPQRDVFVSGLMDSHVEYTIRVWVKTENYWDVHNALFEQIKITFDREEIEIPYNKIDVNIIK